jgi:hypothetical protein
MKLIGLTGYAQHGKDTTAAVLVEDFGFVRIGFADALKSLALEVNPSIPGLAPLRSLVETDGWESAKGWPEVRRLLQDLGTGVRDILGDMVWIRAAERKLQAYDLTDTPVVVSDVRFPNEAATIAKHGGELWRIERYNEDGTPFDNGVGTAHPSEALVASLDANKVLTATNVEQLQGLVRNIMGVPTWASNG